MTGTLATNKLWVNDTFQTKNFQVSDTFKTKNLQIDNELDLNGMVYFGKNDETTDRFTLEKVKDLKSQQSMLRFTINDNPEDSFEIYGDACSQGDCNGTGALRHKFQGNGDATHHGNVTVRQTMTANTVQGKQVCVEDVCLNANDIRSLKSQVKV